MIGIYFLLLNSYDWYMAHKIFTCLLKQAQIFPCTAMLGPLHLGLTFGWIYISHLWACFCVAYTARGPCGRKT